MLGHTALVVCHSRQIWELRLAALADATSEVHRALVAETPALYCLPPSQRSLLSLNSPRRHPRARRDHRRDARR